MLRLRSILLIIITSIAIIIGIFWYRVNYSSNGESAQHLNASKKSAELIDINSEEKFDVDNLNDNNLEIQEPLKFLFFGDIMLDRNVRTILEKKPLTELLDSLNEPNKNLFFDKHVVGANLEGVVTNNGEHYSPVNKYDFAFSIETVNELKDFNFNYFALANNHFLDQGSQGVTETRDNLSEANFYFSGAPDAQVDENSRYDIEIGNKSVAMVSLSMVYKHFNRDEALRLVKQAKSETDLVMVSIHWGNEYEHFFNVYQQEVGKSLVDAGADIIIGHHPHVVQGMEIYNGSPIFYSLGNFIFDQYFSADTQEGLALEIIYSEDEVVVNLLPFKSRASAPTFLQGEEKEIFLEKYITWSDIESEMQEEIRDGEIRIK